MKYSILLWIGLMHNSNAFISNIPVHGKICRRLRLQYKFYIKNNIEHLTLTKDRVTENMITIIKDDLSNDLLYYVKFYNLTNTEQSGYFYIIFYELFTFIIRNEKNKLMTFHISILNIIIYILIKNILLNHYFHHI